MNKKLILTIAVIALTASLIATIYLYTDNSVKNQVTDLQNQLGGSQLHVQSLEAEKNQLQNQINSLNAQLDSLQNQTDIMQGNTSTLQNEVLRLLNEKADLERSNADLQNQLNGQGPRLITRLGATDVQIAHTAYHSNQTRLFIEGVVWNIGAKSASNCRLHVILYQGNEVVNNSYVELGNISALDCVNVRTDIHYYTGDRLTSWKIIPEYT